MAAFVRTCCSAKPPLIFFWFCSFEVKSIVALKCLLLYLWLSLNSHRQSQSGCKGCLSADCSCNFMLWKSLKILCFNSNGSISNVGKIVGRDQILFKAFLNCIFCHVFPCPQPISSYENKWLTFHSDQQNDFWYFAFRLYITCISLGDGLRAVPELEEK